MNPKAMQCNEQRLQMAYSDMVDFIFASTSLDFCCMQRIQRCIDRAAAAGPMPSPTPGLRPPAECLTRGISHNG